MARLQLHDALKPHDGGKGTRCWAGDGLIGGGPPLNGILLCSAKEPSSFGFFVSGGYSQKLYFTLDYKESPVVQWLEHPARLWRVMGSNSMWNSDFLQVDAISQLIFLKSIFIYFLFCFVFIIFLSFILFISFLRVPLKAPMVS